MHAACTSSRASATSGTSPASTPCGRARRWAPAEVGIDHGDQPGSRQRRQRLGVGQGARAGAQQHEPDRPGGQRSHAAPARRHAIRIDRYPQEVSS
jgi:hypothetical protein